MGTSNRFAYVDSLRAIAALLVVWQHVAEQLVDFSPAASGRWLFDVAHAVDFGRLGVVIFFCVSGYVIPSSFAADDPMAGRRFLVRRAFRLYPAFWLSVLAGVLAIWSTSTQPLSLREILLNLTMVPQLFGARPVMGLYWTLAYELAFYGLCLALWRMRGLFWSWTFPLLFAGSALAAGVFLAVSIWARKPEAGGAAAAAMNFAAMFLGVCWRRWRQGESVSLRPALVAAIAAAGCLIVLPLACAYVRFGHGVQDRFFVTFPAAYAGGMALFLLLTGVVRLSWRPLVWIGLASYSLYLFHPVVMAVLQTLAAPALRGRLSDIGLPMLITLATSILVAAAVFLGVERPMIGLGRRVSAILCDHGRSPKAPGAAG